MLRDDPHPLSWTGCFYRIGAQRRLASLSFRWTLNVRVQVSLLDVHKENKKPTRKCRFFWFSLVPRERLELSHRTATASKTVVSTISPPGQDWMWGQYIENEGKSSFLWEKYRTRMRKVGVFTPTRKHTRNIFTSPRLYAKSRKQSLPTVFLPKRAYGARLNPSTMWQGSLCCIARLGRNGSNSPISES